MSIQSERGAAIWVNELLRAYGGPNVGVRTTLQSFQSWNRWLLDWDLETCQPRPKITGKPGVRAVNKAIDETMKLPAAPKRVVRRERVA